MNIQRCESLKARRTFKTRPYIHFGTGGGLFAVAFAGLVFLNVNLLLALLVAGIPAFVLYLYLESRLLVITCPYCKGDININTPWQCGFKGCHNLNVDEFPFVHECENEECHYIPKAYICHHDRCKRPIFLTTDRQELHAARRLENLEFPVKVVIKDLAKDKASKQKDEIGDLEHELGVTTLKKKIEIVKNVSATPSAVKSPLETAMEEIESYASRGMTDLEAETLLIAKADVDFANDEHKRAQKHALLRDAVRERMK